MRKTKPGIGTEYQSYMNEIHHKMKIKKIENEKNMIKLLKTTSTRDLNNTNQEKEEKITSSSPRIKYF